MERDSIMRFKSTLYIFCGLCLLLVMACGPKAVKPQAQLDTPGHHVINGNKFLGQARLDDAFKEFSRAKALDPKFSLAYTGLGLVYGQKGEFKKGLDSLKKAKKYADTKQEKIDACVGYIRVYTLGGTALDEDWLRQSEKYFKKAEAVSASQPASWFYMGQAYKMSYRFHQAAAKFRKVLDLDQEFVAQADREYAVIQRIERAMPGTSVGKKIALLNSITRADVAALFIEELRVDELFKSRTKKTFDTSFRDPGKEFATGEHVAIPAATDIADHVLRADIEAIMEVGLRGLQPGPDHLYQPEKKVTRAEFAMMIEDILIKITGDNSLATKFVGSQAPFPDLRSDLPYFNAVMVCITRNIMETAEPAVGAFNPQGLISGAESLLSIRQMKIQLKKL